MRSRLLVWWTASIAIAIATGACGGNVVVETTSGDGGGGSGGSSGVGGAEQNATCTELCAVGDAFGCTLGDGSCVTSCVDTFGTLPTDCQDEYAAFLDCAADSIPQAGCELVEGCLTESFALGECLGGSSSSGSGGSIGCEGSDCVGTETSCSCKGICDGQTRSVDCALTGDAYSCTCSLDGQQVGSCAEPVDQSTACDLQIGCCGAFF